MFGANDFGAVSSNVGSALGKLPGLGNAAELQYAKAAMRAKGYLESVKRQGQSMVKRTPDGTMNNVISGISGIASGISGLSGAGLFGGGAPATQGIGPVADGAVYGGMLDSMKGLGGMGPVASGATYGAFLDSPRRTSGAFGW